MSLVTGDSTPDAPGKSRSGKRVPAAVTDRGCEREINEDRYAVIDNSLGRVWLVCDGMGGVLGGELAAQLAIDAIRRFLETSKFDSPHDAFRLAVEEANRVIVLRRQNPAFSSMGTTIVGAFISGDHVVIGHAGDSRAYLVRDGAIQQLTEDHTYVQSLVEKGMITPDEALTHPQAHVLTKCLGSEARMKCDAKSLWIWDAREGESEDHLVLCSDGLYGLISDEEICAAVTEKTPQEACLDLVELAKERGGFDNITVAVIPMRGRLYDKSPERKRAGRVARPAAVERPKRALPLKAKVALTMCAVVLAMGIVILAVMLSLA